MTIPHNPENERLKRRYADYLHVAKGYDDATVDTHLRAIAMFEQSTGWKRFGQFHIEQARAFKRWLAKHVNGRTGKPLSKGTTSHALRANQRFFLWLADQSGYRSKISYADTEYFTPDRRDVRTGASGVGKPVPSLEQIRHVIAQMPHDTDTQKRDRALLAFTLLTGARDGAIVTLRLKHIDVHQRRLVQDGRDVHTNGGKTIETWFFPVGDEVEQVVVDWVRSLETEKLFGSDDPLFPRTAVTTGETGGFQSGGLSRDAWRTAEPIRQVFRKAFSSVGLSPFNPHSYRHTLARLGERVCRTPEEFKAWSQNLGHEKVLTTFSSYGKVEPHRQGELIGALRQRSSDSTEDEMDRRIDAAIRRRLKTDGSVAPSNEG